MDGKLVKTKGKIGYLGPGEIGWTANAGGLRAKSFGAILNNCRSVLNIREFIHNNWHRGQRLLNHPNAQLLHRCMPTKISFFLFQVRRRPEHSEAPHGHPHPLNLPINPKTCRYTDIAQVINRDSSVFSAPLETQLHIAFILYRF